MKTFLMMAAVGAMGAGLLSAATAATTNAPSATAYSYRAGTNTSSHDVDSQLTKAIPGKNAPGAAPTSKFSPRPAGVAADIYNKGWVAISPLAPSTEGYGEKNLTATVPANNDSNTRQNPGTERDFGGLKLFGWDF